MDPATTLRTIATSVIFERIVRKDDEVRLPGDYCGRLNRPPYTAFARIWP
jgi:hypothetical protein